MYVSEDLGLIIFFLFFFSRNAFFFCLLVLYSHASFWILCISVVLCQRSIWVANTTDPGCGVFLSTLYFLPEGEWEWQILGSERNPNGRTPSFGVPTSPSCGGGCGCGQEEGFCWTCVWPGTSAASRWHSDATRRAGPEPGLQLLAVEDGLSWYRTLKCNSAPVEANIMFFSLCQIHLQ